MRFTPIIILTGIAMLLSGCQYFTFFKTNTTDAPHNFQNSPEVVCQAMGAPYGYSDMDWCVRREELSRGHNELGF